MKRLALTALLILLSTVLLSSCAIFIYDDDPSCDSDDSGDTITIIFSESLSPLGP